MRKMLPWLILTALFSSLCTAVAFAVDSPVQNTTVESKDWTTVNTKPMFGRYNG